MYSLVTFVLVGLFVASQTAEPEDNECFKLVRPHSFHCCKKLPMKKEKPNMDLVKDCFKGPPNPHTCETHSCVAKKLGYGNDDGTFSKDLAEAHFEKEFENDPIALDAVKKNCLNGDLSKFGPSEDCDVHKLQRCIHHQIFATCPEWDDEGKCNGIKDLVEKCFKD